MTSPTFSRLVLFALVTLSGCGTHRHVSSRSFATAEAALSWIRERAEVLGLSTILMQTDRAGRISGLLIETNENDRTTEEQLLAEVGGDRGEILIAGRRVQLAPNITRNGTSPQTASLASSQSQCDGQLCTNNRSFRNDYYFYRSIGGRTTVTSGRRVIMTVPGKLLFIAFPNIPICVPESACPSGTTLEGSGCYFACVTTTTTTLSVTFFARLNDLLLPAIQRSKTVTRADAEVKLSQWGFLLGSDGITSLCSFGLGGPVECDLVGVCTDHHTVSIDGFRTDVTTSSGNAAPCPALLQSSTGVRR